MDVAEISAEQGMIRIADKAIAVIVRDACLQVPGVAAMVLHGIRVPELALRVQEKVKEALMDSLGLGVTAVDIFVQGIIFGQEGIFENG